MGELTAVAALPLPASTDDAPLTLAQVLTTVGHRHLHVVNIAQDLDTPVRGTSIWDASAPTTMRANDLVFAIGVAPVLPSLSDLMAQSVGCGAAAVVVRGPVPHPWVQTEAQRVGATLLAVPPHVSWERILAAVRTTVALDGSAAPRVGDIRSLADAAAATLGGHVEICDADLNLLAYSNLDGELDDLATRSILSRRLPADFTLWLRTTGSLRRLRERQTPVRIAPPGNHPRLVVPVRAGADLLGFVWLTETDTRLRRSRETEIVDVARVAAALVAREQLVEDDERRAQEDALRSALTGNGCATVSSTLLGLGTADRFHLIAYRSYGKGCDEPHLDPRIRAALTLRMETALPGATFTDMRDRVYVLVPTTQSAQTDVHTVVVDALNTAADRVGVRVVAALGNPWTGIDRLPAARAEVDRVLTLLPTAQTVRVGTADELRPLAILTELRELAAERPHLTRGPIETLRGIDETRNTDYLNTLRAYFDAGYDLGRASRRLYVHRNTLRYRLARIREESGLDLDDPVARFVTELQLRLSDAEIRP